VPLTAKNKRMLPTHVILNKSTGLNKESTALCEQIITIDKSQLQTNIGVKLNDYYMQQIENSLMIQLGIIKPIRQSANAI
jgi:mRNA interferase MazF